MLSKDKAKDKFQNKSLRERQQWQNWELVQVDTHWQGWSQDFELRGATLTSSSIAS